MKGWNRGVEPSALVRQIATLARASITPIPTPAPARRPLDGSAPTPGARRQGPRSRGKARRSIQPGAQSAPRARERLRQRNRAGDPPTASASAAAEDAIRPFRPLDHLVSAFASSACIAGTNDRSNRSGSWFDAACTLEHPHARSGLPHRLDLRARRRTGALLTLGHWTHVTAARALANIETMMGRSEATAPHDGSPRRPVGSRSPAGGSSSEAHSDS